MSLMPSQGSLEAEEEAEENQRDGSKAALSSRLLALETGKESQCPQKGVASRSHRWQATEETHPCQHTDVGQWAPCWTSELQNCKRIKVCCFKLWSLWSLVTTAQETKSMTYPWSAWTEWIKNGNPKFRLTDILREKGACFLSSKVKLWRNHKICVINNRLKREELQN